MEEAKSAWLELGDVVGISPKAVEGMRALVAGAAGVGLEAGLLELVKLRVSQINGCGYCMDMHAGKAREAGVGQGKLDVLAAWREVPGFSKRERAALGWAEVLTRLSDAEEIAVAREEAVAEFGVEGVVHLTWAVVQINGWNRVVRGFGFTPGVGAEGKARRST